MRDRWWMIAALAFTVIAVFAVLEAPIWIEVALGVAVIVLMFKFPWVKLPVFVGGAFLVFQSEAGFSLPKVLYSAFVIFAVGASIANLLRHRADHVVRQFKGAFVGAGLLAAWMVLVTLPYSTVGIGTDISSWARDAITYLLIPAGVVVGADASLSINVRMARLLTAAVGLFAAYAFASYWLPLRQSGAVVTDDTSTQTVMSSIVALTVPMAVALTLAFYRRGIQLLWLAVAIVTIGSVLITGTRTGLVLPFAVLGIIGIVKARERFRVPLGKAAIGAVIGVVGMLVILPLAAQQVAGQDFLSSRFSTLSTVFAQGFGQDYSGAIRQRAQEYALLAWSYRPVLGQGLGVYFPNPNPNGVVQNYSLDTAATYLAKFGAIGSIVLAVSLALIIIALVRGGAERRWTAERTAVRGAAVAWIALAFLGAPTEDKGFALSIALACCLVGASVRHADSAAESIESIAEPTARLKA